MTSIWFVIAELARTRLDSSLLSLQEYSAQFTFREQWQDPRLRYEETFPGRDVPDFVVLATADSSQQIWMPDTFFPNEKNSYFHHATSTNKCTHTPVRRMATLINNARCFCSFAHQEKRKFVHVGQVNRMPRHARNAVTEFFRLTTTLGCEFDLSYFPLDYQNCSIEIESCKENNTQQ